ncbi:hypothetical protein U9M48_029905 [Paspalum notatum var. saurae]|uniref:Uncharacterized protein n=1 Tax=Paspalum notatum var. saurae TaxID=547442 RepID=A0AAQ3TZL0_PASNO
MASDASRSRRHSHGSLAPSSLPTDAVAMASAPPLQRRRSVRPAPCAPSPTPTPTASIPVAAALCRARCGTPARPRRRRRVPVHRPDAGDPDGSIRPRDQPARPRAARQVSADAMAAARRSGRDGHGARAKLAAPHQAHSPTAASHAGRAACAGLARRAARASAGATRQVAAAALLQGATAVMPANRLVSLPEHVFREVVQLFDGHHVLASWGAR